MSKQNFANEKVMKKYLTALLTEDEPENEEEHLEPVAKLLKQVQVVNRADEEVEAYKEKLLVDDKAVTKEIVTEKIEEIELDLKAAKVTSEEKDYRKGSFQALFFKVAGLTVAVPLTELGGIHNLSKLSSLIGKPSWFMGVMVHRDEKLNVVDTAKWVMPEKYDDQLEAALDYKYVIMLSDSAWGMACEQLVNTVTLEQDDVKWSDNKTRRPWLAGLIKDKMCALLDVEELTSLLNNGLDISEEEL
ncbi:chemotaxis protein CheW [Flocculibacter collagenilyticus]|uniref:chemotaxis protein CheW n=1 Tax=Flocculibacter collagenilyticus TaxID=2744479 RepID=UPI0018F4DFEF|nr:chemotaxis protein CheW [Flocculibacter collagenilyticus]